jgi:hypothetical protein
MQRSPSLRASAVAHLDNLSQSSALAQNSGKNAARRYNDGMTAPEHNTKIVWQHVEGGRAWDHGELRKWEQRPLHNRKRNFWWSLSFVTEIELRHVTIDPKVGFFGTVEEALDSLITSRVKTLAISEKEYLDSLIEHLAFDLRHWNECSRRAQKAKPPRSDDLPKYEFLMKSLSEQIAAVNERRAFLARSNPEE